MLSSSSASVFQKVVSLFGCLVSILAMELCCLRSSINNAWTPRFRFVCLKNHFCHFVMLSFFEALTDDVLHFCFELLSAPALMNLSTSLNFTAPTCADVDARFSQWLSYLPFESLLCLSSSSSSNLTNSSSPSNYPANASTILHDIIDANLTSFAGVSLNRTQWCSWRAQCRSKQSCSSQQQQRTLCACPRDYTVRWEFFAAICLSCAPPLSLSFFFSAYHVLSASPSLKVTWDSLWGLFFVEHRALAARNRSRSAARFCWLTRNHSAGLRSDHEWRMCDVCMIDMCLMSFWCVIDVNDVIYAQLMCDWCCWDIWFIVWCMIIDQYDSFVISSSILLHLPFIIFTSSIFHLQLHTTPTTPPPSPQSQPGYQREYHSLPPCVWTPDISSALKLGVKVDCKFMQVTKVCVGVIFCAIIVDNADFYWCMRFIL